MTNKYLLSVYERPVISLRRRAVVGAGIDTIVIVTGGNDAGTSCGSSIMGRVRTMS